jgi:hypothetical protein
VEERVLELRFVSEGYEEVAYDKSVQLARVNGGSVEAVSGTGADAETIGAYSLHRLN